jgi:hypothetical protein
LPQTREASGTEPALRISDLANGEADRASGLGRVENFLAVNGAFAFAENGIGKVFRYTAPSDIPPSTLVEASHMITRLNDSAGFKPGFQIVLCGCELLL